MADTLTLLKLQILFSFVFVRSWVTFLSWNMKRKRNGIDMIRRFFLTPQGPWNQQGLNRVFQVYWVFVEKTFHTCTWNVARVRSVRAEPTLRRFSIQLADLLGHRNSYLLSKRYVMTVDLENRMRWYSRKVLENYFARRSVVSFRSIIALPKRVFQRSLRSRISLRYFNDLQNLSCNLLSLNVSHPIQI